jgi:methionyl-tRNA formyltransferase
VLGYFRSGHVPRRPQDPSRATIFPRRRPADGLIAWEEPALRVRNLIRAVAHPYPGAFSHLGTRTIRIWQAVLEPRGGNAAPGQILCAGPAGQFCVMCGDGALRVLAFTTDGGAYRAPRPGDFLTPAPSQGNDAS